MLQRSYFFAFFLGAALTGFAQVSPPVNCQVNTLPPLLRAGGEAELVSDIVLVCTSPPSVASSVLVNIQVFLNVNLTSRIMNPITNLSEALLLIDEPKPGVANLSNGCPYPGQVHGTPGLPACAPGSGNVYQATQVVANSVAWTGVPFVSGGTRILRLTNIRANTVPLGGGSVMAFVSFAGPISVTISPAVSTVGFVLTGMSFAATPLGPFAHGVTLHFNELFPSSFKKRIENSFGPLTAVHQDVPGFVYCTESGFTPQFSPVTPGAIGSANTGTRLLARFKGLSPILTPVLVVPNEVTSSSGQLVAHLVLPPPPLGPNFAGGSVVTVPGTTTVPTSPASTDLVYEVTAAAPYAGVNGCAVIDTFAISVLAAHPISPASVTGHLAPTDPTPVASPTAPEPRFLP